jgi:cell division protein FtsB
VNVRRAFWPILVSVVFVGILFAGVFPTRTYLAQRAATARAEEKLDVLGEQNAELERRSRELQRDSEIERLAREQYNLVKPGEEAYAVLPPPLAPGEETPRVSTSESRADGDDPNPLQRVWRAVTGIF